VTGFPRGIAEVDGILDGQHAGQAARAGADQRTLDNAQARDRTQRGAGRRADAGAAEAAVAGAAAAGGKRKDGGQKHGRAQ